MPQSTYGSSFPQEWRRMDFGRPIATPYPTDGMEPEDQSMPPESVSMMPGTAPAEAEPLPGTVPTQGLRMESGLNPSMLGGPFTNTEVAQASLKGLLMRNLGFYIVAGFLVGTQAPVSWEGILYSVGNDYIVIYQPDVDRYITGDLYSLKFVEFHNTRSMTPWAGYRRREGYPSW
ncbi:MAG: hypothetical protein ACI3WR_07680 [Oscillospiraceae bacterium]